MAFRDIQRIVREWYQVNVTPQVDSVRSYSYAKEMVLGIVGALVLVGGVWSYRYYANQKETAAQVALAEGLQMYHEAMRGKSDAWSYIEIKCAADYDQYKKTLMAPYFLVLKADALAKQGKIEQASEALDAVMTVLPKDSPMATLYKTKQALIKLDMQDATRQKEGVEGLHQLATDKENRNRDVAQYYLGLYYWAHNDLPAATTIWKDLVASQADEKLAVSPWANLAQEKLAQRGMLPEHAPITAPETQETVAA